MYNVNHCNWFPSKGLPVVVHTVTYRKLPRFFFSKCDFKVSSSQKAQREQILYSLPLSFIPPLIVFLSSPSLSSCLALPDTLWVLGGLHEYMPCEAQSRGKVESFFVCVVLDSVGHFWWVELSCFYWFAYSTFHTVLRNQCAPKHFRWEYEHVSLQKLWLLLSRSSLRTEWKLKKPHISPRPQKLCCCVQWKDEGKTVVYTGAIEQNNMRA